MDGSTTVACPQNATPPVPPTVYDQCCSEVIPGPPTIVDTPDPLNCNGTRVYTYTYVDCGGGTSVWHYTYTFEGVDFMLPPDVTMTVACPDQTDTPPML